MCIHFIDCQSDVAHHSPFRLGGYRGRHVRGTHVLQNPDMDPPDRVPRSSTAASADAVTSRSRRGASMATTNSGSPMPRSTSPMEALNPVYTIHVLAQLTSGTLVVDQ